MQKVQVNMKAEPQEAKVIRKGSSHGVQKQDILTLITQFYDKSKQKVQKSMTKESNKTLLICKQLFQLFQSHPNHQLYELIRLKDVIFNQIDQFNIHISTFLKQFQFLREQLNNQLSQQHHKNIKKQENKQSKNDQNINILRKISFKRQKTEFSNKVIKIDSINKKIMKVQLKKRENEQKLSLQIEGGRFKHEIDGYFKLWFESKKRQYMAVVYDKDGTRGHVSIINDKLQILANIDHTVNQSKLVNILLQDDTMYIVHSREIFRTNLKNPDDHQRQYFSHNIIKAECYNQGLLLFMQDQQNFIYYLFINSSLDVYYQHYLKLSIKHIKYVFKGKRSAEQKVYFVGISNSIEQDLYEIVGLNVNCLNKKIGSINQVITLKTNDGQSCEFMLRHNAKFYIYNEASKYLETMNIDIESNEMIQNCCVLGQHIYVLSHSGKYMLQCLFRPFKKAIK